MKRDMKRDFGILRSRCVEVPYSDVIAELGREDCHKGDYWGEMMPSEDEVEKVYSDQGQVRYFVYTKTEIFLIHIECEHPMDLSTDTDLDYQDWDLLVVPR